MPLNITKMTSIAREITILSALENLSKEKKPQKNFGYLAYPNEYSLQNHEGKYKENRNSRQQYWLVLILSQYSFTISV